MNDYLFEQISNLNQSDFEVQDKSTTLGDIFRVPDGAIEVQKASSEGFHYRVQILDHYLF